MKHAELGVAVALAGLLAAGCEHASEWQSPGIITPSSYRSSDPRVVRTIGQLGRLAAAPPRILVSGKEEAVPSGDPLNARHILADVKGYEIIPIELYADLSREKFGISAEQLDEALDRIRKWVRSAPEGQRPPPEVAEVVSRIGHGLGADGLLVVQTELGRRIEAWVDIVEVATGQVAWRLRFEGPAQSMPRAGNGLMRLEPAIPSAVTEK
jgi:hypothetical protein